MDTQNFIEKAKRVHKDKYDYSKVEYKNANAKVCIICPKHGEFWQLPYGHLNGRGCPICRYIKSSSAVKKTKEQFISESKHVHGDKYDYSKVNYINNRTKVCIICPEHGEFWQRPDKHIIRKQGCPYCSGNAKRTTESFIADANKVHNNKYDYSKVEYSGIHEKVCIICPEHGEFWQTPNDHLHGNGCPGCKGKRIWDKRGRLTVDDVKKQLVDKYADKYDYSLFEKYDNNKTKIPVICKKHGIFYVSVNNHLRGKGCPICGKTISKPENEIYNYICSFLNEKEVIKRNKSLLGNRELDIYIPSKNIAIEYNGLVWHSEKFNKDRNYHINKLVECNKKGVNLIHIFEDEWLEHKDVVLSKIKHIIGYDDSEKIFARNCTIKEVNKDVSEKFLNENHIQGFSKSTVYLGAYLGENIVSIMSFINEGNGKWNLNRFATSINYRCVGIASKLFKHFVRKYNPIEIKSFADRRWTISIDNNLYTKLGFTLFNVLKPDYRYVNGQKREHKFGYRKEKLHRKYGVPIEWTEYEMTKHLKFYRIWDCGLLKYVWKNPNSEIKTETIITD